jgi:protein tyrosine/serine phosphatase
MRFRDYASLDDGEEGFVRAYAGILENGAGNFGEIIRHLAHDDGGGTGGTLVHCSAGKDRSGVLVAVVLDLLGVDRESIARDYNLTEICMADRKPFLIARMVSTGVFGDGETAKRAAERMSGARKESMLATLKYIDERYGGTESYVRDQCRVSQQTIDALRRCFDVRDASSTGNGQAVL